VHPKKVLAKKPIFLGLQFFNFSIRKIVFWLKLFLGALSKNGFLLTDLRFSLPFQNFMLHIEFMKFCQNHWYLMYSWQFSWYWGGVLHNKCDQVIRIDKIQKKINKRIGSSEDFRCKGLKNAIGSPGCGSSYSSPALHLHICVIITVRIKMTRFTTMQ